MTDVMMEKARTHHPSGATRLFPCCFFIIKREGTETELAHLLGLVMVLWLGYLLALAGIDHSFYPCPVFRPLALSSLICKENHTLMQTRAYTLTDDKADVVTRFTF
jgi:hypothetical protein